MNVASINYRRLRRLLSGLLLALMLAQAGATENGIYFREFSIYPGEQPQTLLSKLQLEYQLSDYLREGLLNGMTLENEIQFNIEWHNTWWWNTRRRLQTLKAELKYHPLSKQYQLVRLDTGENWSFPTLIGALEQMGHLEDQPLPALPENAYHNDASLFVVAKLTPKSLHLPLKVQALFTDRYSLESEGVMWPIP
jgi:hypothetical protein